MTVVVQACGLKSLYAHWHKNPLAEFPLLIHGKDPQGFEAHPVTVVVQACGLKSLYAHWHRKPLGEFAARIQVKVAPQGFGEHLLVFTIVAVLLRNIKII